MMLVLATPPSESVAGASGSLRPKPPNRARPASCSACHFGVRTQRLVGGAAVLQMKGVQHTVADKPVGGRRLELRVRAVPVQRAVELARQFAGHLQERGVA